MQRRSQCRDCTSLDGRGLRPQSSGLPSAAAGLYYDIYGSLGGGGPQTGKVKSASRYLFEQDEELPIWPATGNSLASTMQIHNALMAAERSLQLHSQQQELLVSNLYNYPLPNVVLAENMLSYERAEQLLVEGHTWGINEQHISHQHEYLHAVFHHGSTHSMIFGDNVHWRVVCLDGRQKVAYCIDPYGNQGCLSFRSRQANVVMNALKAMLNQRTGWTIRVTVHGWQSPSDGHSCGMWAVWLSHKFMQFATGDQIQDTDFER